MDFTNINLLIERYAELDGQGLPRNSRDARALGVMGALKIHEWTGDSFVGAVLAEQPATEVMEAFLDGALAAGFDIHSNTPCPNGHGDVRALSYLVFENMREQVDAGNLVAGRIMVRIIDAESAA